MFINAWNDNRHIGCYRIQDFQILKLVYCKWEECNDALREYLTSVFGEEYLETLRNYYAIQAEKEINRIKSTLGVGRS